MKLRNKSFRPALLARFCARNAAWGLSNHLPGLLFAWTAYRDISCAPLGAQNVAIAFPAPTWRALNLFETILVILIHWSVPGWQWSKLLSFMCFWSTSKKYDKHKLPRLHSRKLSGKHVYYFLQASTYSSFPRSLKMDSPPRVRSSAKNVKRASIKQMTDKRHVTSVSLATQGYILGS